MRVALTPIAEACLQAFVKNQAELNDVSYEFIAGGNSYSVTPKVEYRWLNGVQDASPFLKMITIDVCDEMVVEDLGYEESGIISGRTDTDDDEKGGDRKPRALGTVSAVQYICQVVDHDTYIRYSDLNRWSENDRAKFLEFINKRRQTSKANDLLMIGWHGVRADKNTNPKENPLGQDVAKGWIQHVKENKPENYLEDAITIGKGGTYESLDELVIALKAQIPMHKRRDLVCLASPELVDVRKMALASTSSVEDVANQQVRIAQNILADGTEVISPEFFPENTVIVTRLKNLHHLTKKGSTRIDPETNSKRSRYEIYHQSLETYAIGDYEQIIVATGVDNGVDNVGEGE